MKCRTWKVQRAGDQSCGTCLQLRILSRVMQVLAVARTGFVCGWNKISLRPDFVQRYLMQVLAVARTDFGCDVTESVSGQILSRRRSLVTEPVSPAKYI